MPYNGSMRIFTATLALLLLLAVPSLAQNLYLLSWAEGDLDGDGVPERVVLVSPDSADPTNAKSRKTMLLLRYQDGKYQQALKWPIQGPVGFQVKLFDRHLSPQADFWGLSYHPPTAGRDPFFKLTFSPGSGEFVQVVSSPTGFQVQGSGD